MLMIQNVFGGRGMHKVPQKNTMNGKGRVINADFDMCTQIISRKHNSSDCAITQ